MDDQNSEAAPGEDPPPVAPPAPTTPSAPTTPREELSTTPVQLVPEIQQASNVPPEFFSHMMMMMQSMSERLLNQPHNDKVKISDVFLPAFDPDGNVGVREWCDHICLAKNTHQLSDYDIRMKVTSLLRGRAKMWADNWLVTTSSWDELRKNIITTFEPENRYSRDVLKFREHSYDSSKDITEFLTQSWILWRRVTKDKLDSSDSVEAVIGTVNDERLRIDPLFDNLNHDLTDQSQIDQLLTLLNKFCDLFTRGFAKSRVNTGTLEIRLKNKDKFVERRPYRLSPVEREKVREIVSELIENNIVRESKSPYSSPVILVKKKNGDDRMCIDYRELNANTIRDHYPLPLISDQIDQLEGGKYYSSLDMASGFHQIPISEDSIEKTAFITPDGLYEYLTMPFGLCNAPSVYQRCINRALGTLLNPGSANNADHPNDSVAQVYIDDVISKSRDFSTVMATLKNGLIMIKNYETPEWHTAVESLQLALNCTEHRTTGTAPLTLLTRRQNCVPPELLRLVNLDNSSIDMEVLERHVQQRMSAQSAKDKERFDKGRALLENDRYLVKKVVGHHGRPRKVAHDQLRRAPQPAAGALAAVSPPDEHQPGPSGLTLPTAQASAAPAVHYYGLGVLWKYLASKHSFFIYRWMIRRDYAGAMQSTHCTSEWPCRRFDSTRNN
ncbi:hypothetical protein ABMA27_003597 [Loxostege sticticalis]|uniref:Reverse transcriptase domain-containing protein n=1 Tax=Loxostege sticticalis TaxID=481309 RepID=A0ABR3HPK1_LOXSC